MRLRCRFIILEADAAVTPWSRICISHADCVLLVGAEEASPQVQTNMDNTYSPKGSASEVRIGAHLRAGPAHHIDSRLRAVRPCMTCGEQREVLLAGFNSLLPCRSICLRTRLCGRPWVHPQRLPPLSALPGRPVGTYQTHSFVFLGSLNITAEHHPCLSVK